MALWHGVLLMVLRSAATTFAENLQRLAQRAERPRRALNAAGVLLQVVSAPMDAVAYSVAPQSMLAPVGTVGLLLNLLAAQRVHGDALAGRDVAATLLVAAGATACMLSGAPSNDDSQAEPSGTAFAGYTACVTTLSAVLAGLLWAMREIGGTADALVNAALGGLLGSTTVVASKVVTATLTSPSVGVLSLVTACLPIALLAPLHLFVLNRGFGRHSLVVMSPAGGAAGLLANVATGRFLYGEVPVAPERFAGGVLLLCGGVLMLCVRGEASEKRRE